LASTTTAATNGRANRRGEVHGRRMNASTKKIWIYFIFENFYLKDNCLKSRITSKYKI
jgi:hypothetical protein